MPSPLTKLQENRPPIRRDDAPIAKAPAGRYDDRVRPF